MKNIINKKIIMIGTPIFLMLLFILVYLKGFTNDIDSIRFKKEYENLNKEYYTIKINKNNPIKYSNYNEIFNVIKKKTGIIFFGYPEDNNSRFAIEMLLNVIENNTFDTKIYYLDIHKDRDAYTIENDKLVYKKENNKELKGTKNYFKLLKLLDKNLSDYTISIGEKNYEVGEKRIYFPSFVFIKNGKVIEVITATIDLESDELYEIFENYLLNMYSSSCEVGNTQPC